MIESASCLKIDRIWQTETAISAREILSDRARAPVDATINAASGYSRDLYRTKLLSPPEERLLFGWLAELKRHAAELASIPDDIRCEEVCADIQEIEHEIVGLRNHLVESNLRLVVAAASKFRGPMNVEFHELVCEGNAILLKAVDLFNVEYGFRFSTYATTALKRAFFNFVQREHKTRNRFMSGQTEQFDGLEDGDTPVEESLEAIHDVSRLLEALDDREREIIVGRYGLVAGEKTKTFRELGERFELSKERIRQIANEALAKMKEKL